MAPTVSEASTPDEYEAAYAIMRNVYVRGGYSRAEVASQFMTHEKLGSQGALFIATGPSGAIAGTTLLLHSGSPLHQVAQDGEREFRLLGVDGSWRGHGIGESLVRACIDRCTAEGATALVLWTQPTMKAAHRLYERLGFVRATERDQADPRGFTRLVYRLDLIT